MKMSQLKTENKYVPFGNTKRKSTSHKQSKISSTEYQKVKKRKDFNASDWKWDGDQDLYVREEMNEAGGHYTQPVYDMIEKYGIEIVMHGLLSVLDADVIQDALSRMNTENESLELSEFQTNTLSSRQTLNVQSKGGNERDNYTSHARDYDSKKGLTTHTTAQQFDGSTSDRFIMPGGSGIQTTTGADGSYKEKKIQMKGPQSWAYDKPKLNASKKVREETEYSDKQIKMAFGILNDPRYRDGNYDGAYATIEKVAKGLARHPSVRNALKRANESVNKYK
mgnify:FL=1